MTHPMAGTTFRFALVRRALVVPAVVLFSACTTTLGATPTGPPPVAVTVDGRATTVPQGSTFGDLLTSSGLKPTDGRLLSVIGTVLDRHQDPGKILLNGNAAPKGLLLHPGDAISSVPGSDTVEGTRKEVVQLSGLRPRVPQLTLDTYAMDKITTIGRVSGETASVTYRPIGKAHVPSEVALSFDDGPWPVQTERVLQILKRFHVKATFFMIGEQVTQYPTIVHEVADAGMTIGNHTWDHPTNPGLDSLAPHHVETEISQTNAALEQVGVHPSLMRPPGGQYDGSVVQEVRRQGLRLVTWSVDPSDWIDSRTKKQILHLVLSHVQPGSIVLMHDGGGDQSATIAALPDIIKGIRKMGLDLVTIPE
jgi:peptidoglycan/xylan/chitin deacetylase (PgdA/CDA1 family)